MDFSLMHRGDAAAATRILCGDKSRDAAAGTRNSVEMARASGDWGGNGKVVVPGNKWWGGINVKYRRRLYSKYETCTTGQGCDQRPPAPRTRRSGRSVDAARAQVPLLGQGGGALRRGVLPPDGRESSESFLRRRRVSDAERGRERRGWHQLRRQRYTCPRGTRDRPPCVVAGTLRDGLSGGTLCDGGDRGASMARPAGTFATARPAARRRPDVGTARSPRLQHDQHVSAARQDLLRGRIACLGEEKIPWTPRGATQTVRICHPCMYRYAPLTSPRRG